MRNYHLMGTFDPRGINRELLNTLRETLDKEGFGHVKIVVTGGFTEDRIIEFEKAFWLVQ